MTSRAIDWPNAVDRFSEVSTSVSRPESTTLPSDSIRQWEKPVRDLLDVVGDQHQRRSVGVGGQVGQPRHQLLAAAEVEPGGGFVEQQQFGVGHHRPRDQHPLALAFGQRAVGAFGEVLGAEALQHVDGLLVVDVLVLLAPAAHHRVAGRDDQVAHHFAVGHALGQRRTAQADPGAQFGHVGPAEPLAEHEGGARRRVLHGGGDAQQRRLARAVRADDHPAFVEFDRPGDGPDQRLAAAPQRYLREVDQQVGVGCIFFGFGHPTIVPYSTLSLLRVRPHATEAPSAAR